MGRMKTGTTPRLDGTTIDYSELEAHTATSRLPVLVCQFRPPALPQRPCHITYTNQRTHDIIRGGLDRSPMYTGVITGVGARYCPVH